MAERNLEKEFDTLRADIGKLREDLASLTKHMRATAEDRLHAAEQTAREYAHEAGERVGEAAARGRARAREGANAVENQIEEHPFTSVTMAFGIGLLIGRLMSR
jgi:ElaB/YqjD/DUF883 family membrane-anchored ribosome-binding protein